jgi:hypothetical protein
MTVLAEASYTAHGRPVRLRLSRNDAGSFALTFGDDGAAVTTPFGTRAQLGAMLPPIEDLDEIGYAEARAAILKAFATAAVPYIGPVDAPEVFAPDRGGALMSEDEEEAILTELVERMRRGET